jgi:hypothetical protein
VIIFGLLLFVPSQLQIPQKSDIVRNIIITGRLIISGGRGPAPRPPICGTDSRFNGQKVFNASTSGINGETCRDLGHSFYEYSSAFNAAETALLQGVDLWGAEAARLATAFEFNARLLLPGAASPRDLCGGRVLKQNSVIAEVEILGSVIGIHSGGEGKRTWTGLSFQVPDVIVGAREVVAAGGQVVREPEPENGEPPHLAMCVDPEGNEFMLSRKRA